MKDLIRNILKESVDYSEEMLNKIFRRIDKRFNWYIPKYFRQKANRKWAISKNVSNMPGYTTGASDWEVEGFIKEMGFTAEESNEIFIKWVVNHIKDNLDELDITLNEDLEYYAVSDATKDVYKMDLKEDVAIYREGNPYKKVWGKFRKGFSNTPEYVLKDFFDATFMKSPQNMKEVIKKYDGDPVPFLGNYWHDFFNSSWKLEILNVNPEDFSDTTVNGFLDRAFGDEDAYLVPDDKERTKIQRQKAKNDATNEPVIVVKKDGKYELIEGWHRTMAALLLGDNGEDMKNWDKVKIRSWVSTPK
jgi:hypothetical protein